MSTKSQPLEFLARTQTDDKLGARVVAAFERGANLTTDEVIQIAHEFGYSFTRHEFQDDVKRDIAARFAAGEAGLADVVDRMSTTSLESACSSGCLSWTRSWHEVMSVRKHK
jgi:hypothetical protein